MGEIIDDTIIIVSIVALSFTFSFVVTYGFIVTFSFDTICYDVDDEIGDLFKFELVVKLVF